MGLSVSMAGSRPRTVGIGRPRFGSQVLLGTLRGQVPPCVSDTIDYTPSTVYHIPEAYQEHVSKPNLVGFFGEGSFAVSSILGLAPGLNKGGGWYGRLWHGSVSLA